MYNIIRLEYKLLNHHNKFKDLNNKETEETDVTESTKPRKVNLKVNHLSLLSNRLTSN